MSRKCANESGPGRRSTLSGPVNLSMADGKGTKKSDQFARFVTYGMIALVGLHTLVLVVPSHSVGVSRGLTAAVAFLAGLCAFWRARWLATRERAAWRWAGAGMVLWGLAHTIETVVGHSSAASNLAVDASDFVYIAAAFPLLMAFSTTRETESLRAIFASQPSPLAAGGRQFQRVGASNAACRSRGTNRYFICLRRNP